MMISAVQASPTACPAAATPCHCQPSAIIRYVFGSWAVVRGVPADALSRLVSYIGYRFECGGSDPRSTKRAVCAQRANCELNLPLDNEIRLVRNRKRDLTKKGVRSPEATHNLSAQRSTGHRQHGSLLWVENDLDGGQHRIPPCIEFMPQPPGSRSRAAGSRNLINQVRFVQFL